MPKLYLLIPLYLLAEFAKCNTDTTFMPTKCEICALTSMEFEAKSVKVHKRLSSEFADITENICNGFNEFKIHKEKTGLERFSRAQSKTIETLKQMREKGVKVELGMPFEMWDQPSAEIFALRQGCESLLEDYEDLIEEWFINKASLEDLFKQLCARNALKNQETSCFDHLDHKQEL
ncbi:DUF3456 domain-containing protein [Caenorhabditis elegans]|uniref:DUF3456 domain-containing protein n=2 Tax=Caenorhabditis elegans TaxID=6239 RepID=G5EDB0_CAEEL|nr:DUF3456 domain-containing protein [Caenorhabditis elegans]CAA94121.2 DUF3456 domain-containing protein [Caenorhabditis elegans]|eukprot:NP_510389.2 Uncharacterized protein CELE_C11H1.7 [Caenorhabditis elegans]